MTEAANHAARFSSRAAVERERFNPAPRKTKNRLAQQFSIRVASSGIPPLPPHPNSGLPEFGQFKDDPSRIHPTWVGEGGRAKRDRVGSSQRSRPSNDSPPGRRRFAPAATLPCGEGLAIAARSHDRNFVFAIVFVGQVEELRRKDRQ